MAMIKCPECGEEISDKAKTCPHCGVEIFVCPECGQVSLGNGPCKSCGYALPVETVEKTHDSGKVSEKNLFDRWIDSAPEEKTKKIIFDVISALFIIIPAIFGFIWYFHSFDNYFGVTPEKLLQLLLSYASDIKQIETLFYMLVFMSVILGAAMDISVDFFRNFNFAKWIRSNHIDITQEINSAVSRSVAKKQKKGDDTEFSFNQVIKEAKEEIKLDDIDSACFMATNPNKAYLLAVLRSIPKIVWCVLEIVILCWVKNMAVSYMRSVIFGEFETDANGIMTFTTNFQIEWWPFLLWAGIIFVIAIFVEIASKRAQEKVIVDTLTKAQKKA